MKADVLPVGDHSTFVERSIAWHPVLPAFVPEPIVGLVGTLLASDIASLRYEASREDVDGCCDHAMVQCEAVEIAVERYLPLACDLRMKNVWQELTRKSNGTFLRPARNGDQDAALVELFTIAYGCRTAQQRETTTTRKQAEQERDRLLAQADELDRYATALGWGHDRKLEEAARTCRDRAHKTYTARAVMAHSRPHDGRARWVVLTLAGAFQRLFDSQMSGLTATIASVILDREIAPRKVRQWWDSRN
jgi:hypothetical protein